MVHGDPKFTANVPRVLFTEVTVKLTVPPAVTVCVAGVTLRLIGLETVTVPVLVAVTAIVVPPLPFFLIETDDGLAVSVQPGPPPETGGPAPAEMPEQSSVLLCTPLPETMVDD